MYPHAKLTYLLSLSVFSYAPFLYAANKPTSLEELSDAIQELEQKVGMTAAMAGNGGSNTVMQPSKTHLGGYGELHYNNLDSGSEIDFHRFVLFIGHKFSDRIRLHSELEMEHSIAGEGQNGEVELEQAYIDIDINDNATVRTGLFLIPVGIINETHEPPVFYGVERNPVENNIIPATWWEGGVGVNGELAPGWGYDVAVTSGLESTDYRPRGGRNKVSEASAENLAYTGRVKWTGMPGTEIAATIQLQDDITQETDPTAGSATLFETHAIVNRGPATVKVLYAAWDLDGTGPASVGRDEQTGWYVEPSYKVIEKVGVFVRYNEWDNDAGSASTAGTKRKQTNIGANYWPHEDVVFKFDLLDQGGAIDDEGFNLGVGYQF